MCGVFRVTDASGAIVTLPVSIRFSISALPAEPMQSRRSDERVGYFNTVYKDLGDHRAVDATRRSTDLLDTQVQWTCCFYRRARNLFSWCMVCE